jgi:hypothetical protein
MTENRITPIMARLLALADLERAERERIEVAEREAARWDTYEPQESPFAEPLDETDQDVPRHVRRATSPRRKRWGIEQYSPYVERWWYETEADRDTAFRLLSHRVGRWDKNKQGKPIDKYRKVER